MANVRKYGCVKPIKRNYNPIRWTPKMPKGNKQMTKNAYGGSIIRRLKKAGAYLKGLENTKAITKAIGKIIDHVERCPLWML